MANASNVTDDTERLRFYTNMSKAEILEALLSPYGDYRMSKWLYLYIGPVILALGTVFNLTAFFVLIRRSMRRTSTYVYLAALTLTDLVVLYTTMLPKLISVADDSLDVFTVSNWTCKGLSALGYISATLSVWLVVTVTLERLLVVVYPLKVLSLCHPRRALMLISVLLLVVVIIHTHFVFTKSLQPIDGLNGIHSCSSVKKYRYLNKVVWPWVDLCLYALMPFVILAVSNTLIIRHMLQSQRTRKRLSDCSRGGCATQDEGRRLTALLLTISCFYLLTTLPMTLEVLSYQVLSRPAKFDPEWMARQKLVRTTTQMLMYINHSFNFLLYCATGKRFRKELCSLLCSFCCISWIKARTHQSTSTNAESHPTAHGSSNLRS